MGRQSVLHAAIREEQQIMTDLRIITGDLVVKAFGDLDDGEPEAWKGWRLEGEHLVFPAYRSGSVYPIPVLRLGSSAAVLDTVMQVAKKRWADDRCIAGLVQALDDILRPQATLCSFGIDKRLTAAAIRERLAACGW
jgi:hypothetical protein